MSSQVTGVRDGGIDPSLRALWRNRTPILLASAAFALAAFLASSLATPSFEAATQIIIEGGPPPVEGARPGGTLSADSVEDQITLLTSDDVLAAVAERLDLASREEFTDPATPFSGFAKFLGGEGAGESGGLIEAMRERLSVRRLNDSRIITLAFTSRDPALARDVADALADEYLMRQARAAPSSARQAAGTAPDAEIAALREAMAATQARIAELRASPDPASGEDALPLASRRSSEIAGELARVRDELVAAENALRGIGAAGFSSAFLEEGELPAQARALQALQDRHATLEAEIADRSITLLDGHPRMQALRAQLSELDREIAEEAGEVRSALEAEADNAQQREASLSAELEALSSTPDQAEAVQAELQALERDAASQNRLLEDYLSRSSEIAVVDAGRQAGVGAEMFARAELPSEPVSPNTAAITATGGLAGFLVSAIAVLLSQSSTSRVREPQPLLLRAREALRANAREESFAPAEPLDPLPAAGLREFEAASVPELAEAIFVSSISRVLVLSAAGGQSAQGSVALARRLSRENSSTVLVDLSGAREASQAMGVPRNALGIAELAAGNAGFADILYRDQVTTTHFVPFGQLAGASGDHNLSVSVGLVLDALGQTYDCTIIDCGTVEPGAIESLLGKDAALVIAAAPNADDEKVRALLERVKRAGLEDAMVMRIDDGDLPEAGIRAA